MSKLTRLSLFSISSLSEHRVQSATECLNYAARMRVLPRCCKINHFHCAKESPLTKRPTLKCIAPPYKIYRNCRTEWVIRIAFRHTLHLIQNVALAIYDLVLSFPTEIRGIWKKGFGTGAVLYLSIRYGTILYVFLQTSESILVPRNTIVSSGVPLRMPIAWFET